MKICVLDSEGYTALDVTFQCTFAEFAALLEQCILEPAGMDFGDDPDDDTDDLRAGELAVAEMIVRFERARTKNHSEPEFRAKNTAFCESVLTFCFSDQSFLKLIPEAERLHLDGMIQIPRSPAEQVRCGFRAPE